MEKLKYLLALTLFYGMDFAVACSTCYGDPNSNAGKGMDMAIITLLGIIGPLLIAIIIGIISFGMKSRKLNQVK
ncbi:MAG: hypothetical protein ACJZ12_05500 [Candidatus Neomarinimicrobiota bacterium]